MPEKIHLPQTHSTNTYLRHYVEAAHDLSEGTVVWTDYQTAGRGQQNNKWESTPGKNLLFTLLLNPHHILASQQFVISQLVSVAICQVLNEITLDFSIKWPNDIYYKEKKIAGILIENDLSGNTLFHSFIGVGLNVNQEVFLSDAPNPISLWQITGKQFDREMLLDQLIERIMTLYQQIEQQDDFQTIHACYMQSLFRKEGFHLYKKGDTLFEASIKNISKQGYLMLTDRLGEDHVFDFKEVTFVLLE